MPLVAWIAEQPWLSLLSAAQFRKSGIPRALRGASAPEAPCWSPLWPPATTDEEQEEEEEEEEEGDRDSSGDSQRPVLGCAGKAAVGLGGLGPAARAQAAAPFFPPPLAASASSRPSPSTSADPDAYPRRRSVAEYHAAFDSREATPAGVAAAALEALRSVGGVCRPPLSSSSSSASSSPSSLSSLSSSRLAQQQQRQPAANWFIAVDEGDVMRQAEAATARYECCFSFLKKRGEREKFLFFFLSTVFLSLSIFLFLQKTNPKQVRRREASLPPRRSPLRPHRCPRCLALQDISGDFFSSRREACL